jgi:hypothetical protein
VAAVITAICWKENLTITIMLQNVAILMWDVFTAGI